MSRGVLVGRLRMPGRGALLEQSMIMRTCARQSGEVGRRTTSAVQDGRIKKCA